MTNIPITARPYRRWPRPVAILSTFAVSLTVAATGVAQAADHGPSPVQVHRSNLTQGQAEQLSSEADQNVIVVLRDQLDTTLKGHDQGSVNGRADAVTKAQGAISDRMRELGAKQLQPYHFLNAVGGTVSAAAKKDLQQDPSVLAVVPDRMVSLRKPEAAPATADAAGAPVNTTAGLCGTRQNPLVEPEGLRQINADAPTEGITGQGVKVAVFSDGIDPGISDYLRPDGTPVIFDYQDFTGDGPDGVTLGGEAFGDVSSIAAQGRETYDLSKEVNPNLPLPNGCDIKIQGVATGAQVAVMKVFGQDTAPESQILRGLDYAVSHDYVDVLSQSFGGSAVPLAGDDPIAMFDAEAVRDGISVVVSTGDAGPTNTVGSPAADADGVISVGATTSFRTHAQLSEHGYQLGGGKGWEDDNIATLSSGGFTSYGPNSVDLVAPGDGGWANCSTRTTTFTSCANPFGAKPGAPPIEDFGGTSQSTPFVAGVAALVIQAYRSTHHGQTPTPAVVKRILTSTATDLSAPVEEQGAGQVNARAAVELARAFQGTNASRSPGDHLSLSTNKITTTAAPGSVRKTEVTVRNDGPSPVTIRPTLKQFSEPKSLVSTSVDYDPSAKNTASFTYWLDGKPQPYVEKDFQVPAGYQRLTARLGFPATTTTPDQLVTANEGFLVLFDPSGRLAQDSNPQGASAGFGQADIRNPEPGKWRAIMFARPAAGGYSGPMTFSASVQKLDTVRGSALPQLTIPAGAERALPVGYTLPNEPGDYSAGVYFGDGLGVLPVLMRATVPVSAGKAGTFSGELTGGNGRPALGSETKDYQFQVPEGLKDLDIDVHVDDAAFDTVATLIAPDGRPVDSQTTDFIDMSSPIGEPTVNEPDVHLSWQAPAGGLWELDLLTLGGDKSGKTSVGYSGRITFNTVDVSSSGVPNSPDTVIRTGDTVTATVTVKNTGNAPEMYYIDPRRSGQTTYLAGFATVPGGTVGQDTAQMLVPPGTSSAVLSATANQPIEFATSPVLGSPGLLSTAGTTAVVGVPGPVEASEWSCGPSLVGPFSKPAPPTSFTCAGLVTTDTINESIGAVGGNLWDTVTDPNDTANSFFPLETAVVQPGQSTTLTVRISPTVADTGQVVQGYLAVQTLNLITMSSDELVHLPYQYKVENGS